MKQSGVGVININSTQPVKENVAEILKLVNDSNYFAQVENTKNPHTSKLNPINIS